MNRARYDTLVEQGVLGPGDRVELLDGLLVVSEPQGSRHAALVAQIRAVLERAFGPVYHVREEKPLALDDTSEPEPDLAVVQGRPRDYLGGHPSSPVLVVEVAETSIQADRLRKGGLYARAGIADYWIVNVAEGVLEVYRQPVRAAGRRTGWTYSSVAVRRRGDIVSPLARPRARVRVIDLLP